MENRVMLADSYKYSHASQYPRNMVSMYDYMEARGGVYPATKFFGLQYYLKKYLSTPITYKEIYDASNYAEAHGVPFDFNGWKYIVEELHGNLPVKIKAVPEGSLIPTGNVLMTIESTDPKVPWIAGWLETLLMKIWYPTTVATKSHYVKQMLLKYGSADWAEFAYHNFGDRGATSVESAAIGGIAHLSAGFKGTDNFNSLSYATQYYNSEIAGYSVFATEHSSTTSHGRDKEHEFVVLMLEAHPDSNILSFVADSYDVYDFTKVCTKKGGKVRELIESRPHQVLVLRPDSGNPIEVLEGMLKIMHCNGVFDETIQGKLFSSNYRILWGDGITPENIEEILQHFTAHTYSDRPIFAAENFIFGSGGDLMQNMTRDTCKFAIKCSSITTEHWSTIEFGGDMTTTVDHDIFKDPITDPGKTSKKGKVTTALNRNGKYCTVTVAQAEDPNSEYTKVLYPVYLNGQLLSNDTLDAIRKR